MANSIILDYEITNAKADETTNPENYLVFVDYTKVSQYQMPPELGGKFTNVYLTGDNFPS